MEVDCATKERTIRNFPMQANGAEMLRLACCYVRQSNVAICAPVHDALLIEAASAAIDDAVEETQMQMERASIDILDGFPLRTDVELIHHPSRLLNQKSQKTWDLILSFIGTACSKTKASHVQVLQHPLNILKDIMEY